MQCPVQGCNGTIIFNTYKLLEGSKFVCPVCNSQIGLAPDSKDKVENTMDKFETMRKQLLKKKKDLANQ